MDRVAAELIARVLPEHASRFVVEIIPSDQRQDVFEIDSVMNKIVLRGNNPVAVASALNWYLKNFAQCQFSWCGDQLHLPAPLPVIAQKVRVVNPNQYRAYFNYCTLSYTATWWDWKRWEREIDFMALNGINLPLSVTGIEGAWYYTLLRLGFTDAEAREFLVGPAYQAWQWMQNIERYGGPLPRSWIDSHIQLGRQILDRQRELGMQPIQQGFSGAVPRLLQQKFPQAAIAQQPDWFGFIGTMQLDPLDPLFAKMGGIFLEEQERLFGTSHFYGCDPFHESAPPKTDPAYLRQVGEAIANLLTDHDPRATWCMQSWSIRKEIATAVPKDRLLVLDLGSRWKNAEAFWGYPFVAGLIHNFGARTRMCGNLAELAENPFAQAQQGASNCCGMGIFPEGIEHNPVYYDLAFDLIWRNTGVKIETWLGDYARRRYGTVSGSANEAWQFLNRTVYSSGSIHSSVFAARPALDLRMADPNTPIGMPYDPAQIFQAWELLLSEADQLKKFAGYRYDVVDLGRQVLADLAQPFHWEVANAFLDRDSNAFVKASRQFLDLFTDADTLCGTEPVLSYRRWMRSAQAWATTPDERVLYTFNANMLITHWGGDFVPLIFEYSWREWGGLLGDYYRGRWTMFHSMLSDCLAKGESWSEAGFKLSYARPVLDSQPFYQDLYNWEMEWIRADKSYTVDVVGDPIGSARDLLEKYKPLANYYFSVAGRQRWESQHNRVHDTRLGEEFGQCIWRWAPPTAGSGWRELSFDLTPFLRQLASSDFNLLFRHEAGGAVNIREIVVEQDGIVISQDTHEGSAGPHGSGNNTYQFHLPMVVPNARYTLKTVVCIEGKDQPAGALWLRATHK